MSVQTHEAKSLERPITTEGQLLVEGRVPEMFFREIVADYRLESLLEVRTFGDIDKGNLQTWLEFFTAKPAFREKVRRLGIIRDAEKGGALSAFESVRAALRSANLNVPAQLGHVEGQSLGVGIFILPDCKNSGMLETLCLQAVEEQEKGDGIRKLPIVDEFFNSLQKAGVKSPSNQTKAKFAGYALASDVIDPQLGRAAQRGAIPWNTTVFAPLKSFLEALAGRT